MSDLPQLGYVSPLPPVRSGISDYSVDLLDRLFNLEPPLGLVVVRVPGQEVRADLVERYGVVDVEVLERSADRELLPWYQMGNNLYHAEIGRLARERPGVLTLHDVWLHHLLVEESLARGEIASYVERLTEEHDWIGGAVALPPRWSGYSQAALFALPAHRSLLEAQRGVLVHSEWAARLLAEEEIDAQVAVVPMPMPAPAVEDAQRQAADELRQRLGVPSSSLLLGSFGFQTPIKRTGSVVRCLAEQGLEDVHLLVAGEASPAVDLDSLAEELGVRPRVHEVGFLAEDDFQVAIEACDLCVNLRYPTAGETSASLLRTFARGRAAVVSDYAQFADFGDDVAVRIPVGEPEEEASELAQLLRPLQRDRSRVEEMGRRARRLIETRHDPAASARAMIEAIGSFDEEPPATSRSRPRPTSLTWGELPGALDVRGASDWPAGERRQVEIVLHNRGFARWLPAEAGPGGVALEVQLLSDGRDLRAGEPWVPLPRAVDAGESCSVSLWLRRPPGPARLRIEAQVVGGESFSSLGGPRWEGEL